MNKTTKLILIFVLVGVIAVSLTALAWLRIAWLSAPVVQAPQLIAAQMPELVLSPEIEEWNGISLSTWTNLPLQGPDGDRLVMGGSFLLEEGETLNGSLVVMGGTATLERGSTVEKDVVLMGGSVHVDGRIEGDVLAFGGLIDLGEEAVVEGDVSTVGGNLSRASGSRIEGQVFDGVNLGWNFWTNPVVVPGNVRVPTFSTSVNPFWEALSILVRSFIWAAVAILLMLLVPDHSKRVSQVLISQPLVSGGLGLLTVIVAPIILVVTAITIIGIPISLVGFFVLFIAWVIGVIAVGLEFGKRLGQAFKQEWALPVSAAVGVFLVTLVNNSVEAIVPCVGWLLPFFVGILGLGAVVLTRFGTQDYPPYEGSISPGSLSIEPGGSLESPPELPTGEGGQAESVGDE